MNDPVASTQDVLAEERQLCESVAVRLRQLSVNADEAYAQPLDAIKRILDARHEDSPSLRTLFDRTVSRWSLRREGGASPALDKKQSAPASSQKDPAALFVTLCRRHAITLAELTGKAGALSFRALVALGLVTQPTDLAALKASAADLVAHRERLSPTDIARFLGEPGCAYVREQLLTRDAWLDDRRWTADDLVQLGVRVSSRVDKQDKRFAVVSNWPAWHYALYETSEGVEPVWSRGTPDAWRQIGLDTSTAIGQHIVRSLGWKTATPARKIPGRTRGRH